MSTPSSSVSLVPITMENFRDVLSLDVEPDQRRFVANTVVSIAQARVQPWWEIFAVEASGELVGFCMYGLDPRDGVHWICRLLIDKRFQRKGYGRAAMQAILADLDCRVACDECRISFTPDNQAARALYESLGFEDPDLMLDGETVLVRPRGRTAS